MYLPVLARLAVANHFSGYHLHREATHQVCIVDEESFDGLALVSQRDNELGKPVRAVVLQDVPQDRPTADLDHRLWTGFGFLGKPGPESTGQYHRSHDAPRTASGAGDSARRGSIGLLT